MRRDASAEETRGAGAQEAKPEWMLVGCSGVNEAWAGTDGADCRRPCKARKVKCGEERPHCLKLVPPLHQAPPLHCLRWRRWEPVSLDWLSRVLSSEKWPHADEPGQLSKGG